MTKTPKLNRRRIATWIKYLEKVKPDKFDMGSWCSVGKNPNDCGTTACALGWATTVPSFHRAGLRLVKPRRWWNAYVTYGKKRDYQACEKFFGMGPEDAANVCSPNGYVGKEAIKLVVQKLRSILKTGAVQ